MPILILLAKFFRGAAATVEPDIFWRRLTTICGNDPILSGLCREFEKNRPGGGSRANLEEGPTDERTGFARESVSDHYLFTNQICTARRRKTAD